jgi:hypothetical protein
MFITQITWLLEEVLEQKQYQKSYCNAKKPIDMISFKIISFSSYILLKYTDPLKALIFCIVQSYFLLTWIWTFIKKEITTSIGACENPTFLCCCIYMNDNISSCRIISEMSVDRFKIYLQLFETFYKLPDTTSCNTILKAISTSIVSFKWQSFNQSFIPLE